jgi:hypothetical protein
VADLPTDLRLTRRQAAIIGAFTGVTCGPFGDIHAYVDSLPGFAGITTIGFMDAKESIREASRADFLAICSNKEQPDDVLPALDVSDGK